MVCHLQMVDVVTGQVDVAPGAVVVYIREAYFQPVRIGKESASHIGVGDAEGGRETLACITAQEASCRVLCLPCCAAVVLSAGCNRNNTGCCRWELFIVCVIHPASGSLCNKTNCSFPPPGPKALTIH